MKWASAGLIGSAVAAAWLACVPAARGEDVYWICTDTTGYWEVATNWDLGRVPVAGDAAGDGCRVSVRCG